MHHPCKTPTFFPGEVAKSIAKGLTASILNITRIKSRLSGAAKTLTFGAQTGRGSEKGCVVKKTHEKTFEKLIRLVRSLAQATVGTALPYLGFQIFKLERGQDLNQHEDYHNHPDLASKRYFCSCISLEHSLLCKTPPVPPFCSGTGWTDVAQ